MTEHEYQTREYSLKASIRVEKINQLTNNFETERERTKQL